MPRLIAAMVCTGATPWVVRPLQAAMACVRALGRGVVSRVRAGPIAGLPARVGRWAMPALVGSLCLAARGAEGPPPAVSPAGTRLTVPRLDQVPRIDGTVAPGEWDGASAFTGFYDYATGNLLEDGPSVFLGAGPDAIHLLFVVPMPAGRELIARVTERDGQVFTDDSVEVFLETPAKDLYQVVLNSRGTIADFRNASILWNSSLVAAGGRVEGSSLPPEWGRAGLAFWLVEAALPWSDLGLGASTTGLVLRANLAVNRPTPWAVLAPTSGRSYAETECFCEVVFLAAESPRVQVLGLGRLSLGEVALRLRLANPGPLPATLIADLRTADSATAGEDAGNPGRGSLPTTQTVSVGPGLAETVTLTQPLAGSPASWLEYRVSVDGSEAGTLCRRAGAVAVAPALRLAASPVPSRGYVVLDLDSSGVRGRVTGDALAVTAEVRDAVGQAVLSQSAAVAVGTGTLRLDCRSLAAGAYTVQVRATHAGTEVAAAEASFRHGGVPVWLSSRLYDDYAQADRVPLPWTPVQCGERSVSVWGRSLVWEPGSLLPSRIRTGSTELLAAPIRLVGVRAGRRFTVPLADFRFTEQRRARASFTARGEAEGLSFTAAMWIEYDGLLWVTLSAEDQAGSGVPVESLRLVTTLPASRTRLYQTFARKLAGWVGEQPIPMAWIADPAGSTVNFYHWFGDERGGLGFTYTTLAHWQPESVDRFCELRPGTEVTTYAANLLETPGQLPGRTFVLGIQPTPIKPLPPDYHAMLAASVQFAPWKAWEQVPEAIDMTLTWPTPTGFAMKGLQDPYHVDEKILTDYVKRTHEKGVAFVGVASCPQKMCGLDEWFADYRLEWLALPESQLAWDSVPHFQNCGRALSLRKWLFYGWAVENVGRFGLDGLYFDGWQAGTMGCSNPHHDCGWTDAQGQRQLTVPVLEGREFNHAMVLFLEDQVNSPFVPPRAAPGRPGFPRYHYWIHSWEFVPPLMGFATAWLTGEFAGYPLWGPSLLTPEGTYGKCLGLGLFRSRALSTNWGVPNLFDTLMWEHTENHASDRQTLMAYAWFLPHGVPAGLIEYANQKTLVEMTRILLAFGTRSARFVPCWEPNPYLVAEPELPQEVMVATWDRADAARVLAVVSNLSVAEGRSIGLRWRDARLPVSARDARTGSPVVVADGRLAVELDPESFVLLWFER